MNDADLAAGFCRAFNRTLEIRANLRAGCRERRVRLVAGDAVIEADLLQLARKREIIFPGKRMCCGADCAESPIVIAHGKHGKIPGVKPGFCDVFHGFFFADQNGRGFDLCGCSHENSSLLSTL